MSEKRHYREVTYRCSSDRCGHTQTIRYFLEDSVLPVTCCVKCRAGFGVESVGLMIQTSRGMFPESKGQLVAA